MNGLQTVLVNNENGQQVVWQKFLEQRQTAAANGDIFNPQAERDLRHRQQ